MEEADVSSMVSNAKTNGQSEPSYSHTSNHASRPNKRSRHDKKGVVLGRFKGVVPHNNGSWGAQIYANHQRIWLGTFRSDKEAATAYDSAAIKLRSGDSPRNFPWTEESTLELDFQNRYSTDAVLRMIRDGSYPSRLADFLQIIQKKKITIESRARRNESFPCILLFQKELTPSDVGSLNRLVIPKKYALKYFPGYIENEELFLKQQEEAGDMELVFYDKEMRIWKFRYSYWKSSQSFVLTRGWIKFVKENKLKPRDVIAFYSCRDKNGRSFIMIDPKNHSVEQGSINKTGILELESAIKDDVKVDLDLKLGKNSSCRMDLAHEDVEELELPCKVEKKEFRLFGVQIIVE
ncbi:hypothetical protein SLE2022_356980 [Rubroshorea leprosula]